MNPSANTTVKVKNVSSNTQILNNTCPEIFDTSPRPGGFLKVMVPTRSQDYMVDACSCPGDQLTDTRKSSASFASSRFEHTLSSGPNYTATSTTSREFRLKRAIEETDWELTVVDETDTVVGISSVMQDTTNMLAVSISCVMLMAADLPVPEDYLVWTQSYLQCIKDDDGVNPPNIQRIISEIIKRSDPSYQASTKETFPVKRKGGSSPESSNYNTLLAEPDTAENPK